MSVILFAMSEKTKTTEKRENQNTEKQNEYSSLYGEIVMDKMKIATDKLGELFDILHRLLDNPHKIKAMDNIINFSVKFKQKIEIPHYLAMVIFEDDVRITGIEIKGNNVYFDYDTNNGSGYRYYIDFGANRLTVKDYVLFLMVFRKISDDDLFSITNVLSDIIAELNNEKDYILSILKDSGAKIEK